MALACGMPFLHSSLAIAKGDRDAHGDLTVWGSQCSYGSPDPRCIYQGGQNDSERNADRARDQARNNEMEAKLRNDLSDKIRRDTPTLEGRLAQIRASNDPPATQLQRINQMFSRRWDAGSSRLSSFACQQGLCTVGDLYKNGPAVQKRLQDEEQDFRKLADQQNTSANQATNAAKQMAKLDSQVAQNIQRMHSVDSKIAIVPKRETSGLDGMASLSPQTEGSGSAQSGKSSISAPQFAQKSGPSASPSSAASPENASGNTLSEIERALLDGSSDPSKKLISKSAANTAGNEDKLAGFMKDLDKHLNKDDQGSNVSSPPKETLAVANSSSGRRLASVDEVNFPSTSMEAKDFKPIPQGEFLNLVGGSDSSSEADLFQRISAQYRRRWEFAGK